MELTKRVNLTSKLKTKLSFDKIKKIIDFLMDDSKYGSSHINDYSSYETQNNMKSKIFK